jgi:hypothetical protein
LLCCYLQVSLRMSPPPYSSSRRSSSAASAIHCFLLRTSLIPVMQSPSCPFVFSLGRCLSYLPHRHCLSNSLRRLVRHWCLSAFVSSPLTRCHCVLLITTVFLQHLPFHRLFLTTAVSLLPRLLSSKHLSRPVSRSH